MRDVSRVARRSLALVAGVVVVVGFLGACGSSSGSSGQDGTPAPKAAKGATVVELPTGDRFSVVLPANWKAEDDAAYLYINGEGAVSVDEADCPSAQACQDQAAELGGETAQETVGDVTYYEHSGGVVGEHWYVEWNGHVYDITLSLVGPSVQDPSKVQAVVRSFEWLP